MSVPLNDNAILLCERYSAIRDALEGARDYCVVRDSGGYAVRFNGKERLRTDDPCLVCSYLANKLGLTFSICRPAA